MEGIGSAVSPTTGKSSSSSSSDDGSDSDGFVVVSDREDFVVVKPQRRPSPATAPAPAPAAAAPAAAAQTATGTQDGRHQAVETAVAAAAATTSPATAAAAAQTATGTQDGRHQAVETAAVAAAAMTMMPTPPTEASSTRRQQPTTTAGLPPPLPGRAVSAASTSNTAIAGFASSVPRAAETAPAENKASAASTATAGRTSSSSSSFLPMPTAAPSVLGAAAPRHHRRTTADSPPSKRATRVSFASSALPAADKAAPAEGKPSAPSSSGAGGSSSSSRSSYPPMPIVAPTVLWGGSKIAPEDIASAFSAFAAGGSSSSSGGGGSTSNPPMSTAAPSVFGGAAAPAASSAAPATTPVPPEAPPLPPHYVERSDLLEGAVRVLANNNRGGSSSSSKGDGGAGSFYALLGKSASGKSTLASAIVRDPATRNAFRGGIFWMNLGNAGSAVATTRTAKKAGSGWASASGTSVSTGGGGGEGAGGGRLRALLRVLLAQVSAADPFPVPPSTTGDFTGDTCKGNWLSASAGEAARQLASMNRGASGKCRLLVLDDFGCGAHDDLNGSLEELERAGFVLLVVCTELGVLSMLQGKWSMIAVPQPPTRTARNPARPLTFTRPGRYSGNPGAGTAYFSVLRTLADVDAADMLLTRARQGRDAEAAAGAEAGGRRRENNGGAGDALAANAAAMKCAVELAKRWGEMLPLALALVNAVAAARGSGSHPFGGSLPFGAERYSWIERVLCDIDTGVEHPSPSGAAATRAAPPAGAGGGDGCISDGGAAGLRRAIKLAFNALLGDTTKQCFVRLGVLPGGTVAPSEMLSNLWDQGVTQTMRTIDRLSDASLLHETHPGSRSYRVHEPILAFAKAMLLGRDGGPGRCCGTAADDGKPKAAEEGESDSRDASRTTWTGTRDAAVASHARYLSRVNTLLRFSGGGSGTGVGETEAARRCGERVLLGGLPALAALWQSLEDVRSEGGCGRDRDGEGAPMAAAAAEGPLLQHAYGAALEGMGVCVEAASGYWAAAKLTQLQGLTEEAARMARKSVRVGNALLSAGAIQATRCYSEAALLRVHKDMDDEVVSKYERWLDSAHAVHGPSHPAVSFASTSLAGVLLEQGKLLSAGARYREALWVLEVSLGDDHPLLSNALIDIAEAKLKQLLLLPDGEKKKLLLRAHGGELCSRALSIYDNDLGVMEMMDSRGQATSLVRLALLLEEQANIEGAERLCRRALSILEKNNMRFHVQAGAVLVALADLLHEQFKTSRRERHKGEATELLRQAVDIGESWFEKDPAHEKLALWRNKLATSYTHQGKHVEAAAQYLKVVEKCNKQPSIDQAALVNAAHEGLAKLVGIANFDELLARTKAYRHGGTSAGSGATAAAAAAAAAPTAAATAAVATGEAADQNAASGAAAAASNLAAGGDSGDNHAAVATENRTTEDDECMLREESQEREEKEEEQEHRQEKEDDDHLTLEAAAFYLYANNPQSLFVDARDATEAVLNQDEMDDNDRELQEALSLSLRAVATLDVDQ